MDLLVESFGQLECIYTQNELMNGYAQKVLFRFCEAARRNFISTN